MAVTPALERHIQSLIAAILCALLVWAGVTLNELTREMAGVVVTVAGVKADVAELNKKVDEGVLPIAQQAIDRLNRDVEDGRRERSALERRLDAVERSKMEGAN